VRLARDALGNPWSRVGAHGCYLTRRRRSGADDPVPPGRRSHALQQTERLGPAVLGANRVRDPDPYRCQSSLRSNGWVHRGSVLPPRLHQKVFALRTSALPWRDCPHNLCIGDAVGRPDGVRDDRLTTPAGHLLCVRPDGASVTFLPPLPLINAGAPRSIVW